MSDIISKFIKASTTPACCIITVQLQQSQIVPRVS